MRGMLACLALLLANPAYASPADDLNKVIADHWSWWLAQNPVTATILGMRTFDQKLGDISLESQDRAAKAAAAFLVRLDAIPVGTLTASEFANKAILRRLLAEQVEANGFGQRMMLFNTYDSLFQGYAGMADSLPFDSKADYVSYLDRLSRLGGLASSSIAITRKAVAGGFIQPCEVLDGFETTITGAVAGTPEMTRFYGPFLRGKPSSISDADWSALKAKAVAVIRDTVAPQYDRFAAYYLKEYKPKCRASVGASAMPQGAEFYASRIRVHTTTGLSADDIHAIGLGEVTRIKGRMDALAKRAGYMSRAAMIDDLRTNPKYYAQSVGQLLGAAALSAKQIDGIMPRYFGHLPRLPYGLRAIPKETAETTTTAYYGPGSPPSGIAGTFYVNTSKLGQRPLFELPALTAHEAVPGHHHQIALQQELSLPDFRKYAVGFTAFVEGWGLYAEYLGEEMGLYDTPEKMMGRLSYEMWRACRLVVDTGIHAKGWSKAEAVSYMRNNTALTDANIEAEVNRYISWPGQALGYKLGEIKIRELRAKAESALGSKFDLRRFHDAVLEQGAVPLDVLDQQVIAWIREEVARR
jgi:uncharacterized protein (DUF885 family)